MTEEALFELALNAASEDRAALLDRLCQGNAALRERIEKLLAADAARDESMNLKPTLSHHDGLESEGAVVAGRYKLRQQIGEGGMGTVWVADQTEPVKRKVALKLIKKGMDSRSVLARFEQERQALAVMDHPNIAKVLDGGLTETGQPFFVMELVAGRPLVKFCDEAKLGLRERLELFVPICQAVQHAHQKGIIHRDLKPANILVTLVDGKPTPKIIDFGVAKAVTGKLTEESLSTHFGAVVGTVEYMAPEQAGLTTDDVDTRADVYSLGVILYELLTGLRPFDSKRLRTAALDELLRIVREEDAPSLSSRLSTDESLATAAAVRGLDPKKLLSLVKGELDWIVQRCLEKDRNRRYETANGVARDVQRYLADEPVEARPASARYRLRKFVRRNRVGVFVTLFVAASLVAILFNDQVARRRLRFERDRAVAAEIKQSEATENERKAKEVAQAKEAEAYAIVKFFEDKVFAAGRPKGQAGGLGSDVTLRDAIHASLPSLGTSFTVQPLVEARLRHTIGSTFDFLGEYAQAAEQLERAHALFTRHLGPDHHDSLTNLNSLSNSYLSLSRHSEALKLLEEVVAAQKRVLPPDHRDTLKSMNNLAICYDALNRRSEALKLREKTVAAQKRVLPPDHPDTLSGMINLAVSYDALKRYPEALKLREEALAALRRVLPPDHPDILRYIHNLIVSYDALNRHDEALKLGEELVAARKRVLPPDHPDTLRSMHNLAVSYATLKRHTEAMKLREEALAARKRALPPDHPDTLKSMGALAESYQALNRPAESLRLREETLAARRRVLPLDHPDTLRCMYNLALDYCALNRHIEAIPLIDELLPKSNAASLRPNQVTRLIVLRIRHFQELGDVDGCRTTAEIQERLNHTDAPFLYNAACSRAIVASLEAKSKKPEAARLTKEEAERSMAWLQKAIAAGFNDFTHMKKDAALDFLRDREDFKKLLAELEKRSSDPQASKR